MPYAIAIWVETEVINTFAPKIFDGTNLNRYIWNLNSMAKTTLMSSECAILFEKSNEISRLPKSKKLNSVKIVKFIYLRADF